MIRSCSSTIFVKAAAGYPLVVLAGGYEINRVLVYFNPNLSLTDAYVRQLWATATIRASSVGSTIYYAVISRGVPNAWPLAMVPLRPPSLRLA